MSARHGRAQAQGWLIEDAEAVLLGIDGRTPLAGAGRRPGGYGGWIRQRAAMGALRLVQTDTVPTLLDAMRAAEDLLRAVPRRPRCEKGGRSDHVGQHHQTHRT